MIALDADTAIAAGAALVLLGACFGVWIAVALSPLPDAQYEPLEPNP